jgi:hypothetical protein
VIGAEGGGCGGNMADGNDGRLVGDEIGTMADDGDGVEDSVGDGIDRILIVLFDHWQHAFY